MWAILQNRSVWWGLGFVLLPGTLITLNRMTVDVAEYACLAAGLYFWRRDLWIGSWIAGAAAFLARDLVLILIAALAGMCLLQRAWGRAAMFAAAALPAFLWDLHVAHTIAISRSAALIPDWAFHARLIGPLLAMIHPQDYPIGGWIKVATQWLDRLSIAGVTTAACVGAALVSRRPF